MSSGKPFTIAIPEASLNALQQKLTQATLVPDELGDAGWDYGVPLADVRRLLARWRDGYDWRAHEAALNTELPQFTRDIEVDGFGTLNIHYVHKRSELDSAIPLLFVHGWPGSFIEVRKILPLLTAKTEKGEHPSFHVVALSLPGYGFSEAPRKKGFTVPQYAEVGNKLMIALGYDEYVSQGGDWGYLISKVNATQNGPEHVKAWHTNFPVGKAPSLWTPLAFLSHLASRPTAADKVRFERTLWFEQLGSGYFAEQSTQPQTLGYAIADSPVGLLAWIYEKLVQWTDGFPWEDDEVLTWVSIYLFSRAGPAATFRIYYEIRDKGYLNVDKQGRPSIPLGLSRFPKEIVQQPKSWASTVGNVVFDATHEHGGHFAAHEHPDVLVGDLRAMFGKGGPAYGVVKGKNGYSS